MTLASQKAQPPGPVSSDGGDAQPDPEPAAKASKKTQAPWKMGPTLPVQDHTVAAASSAEASVPTPARAKPVTFAGRYPPPQPQRRAGWDNMVRDYDEQKEEDAKNGKKRKMT